MRFSERFLKTCEILEKAEAGEVLSMDEISQLYALPANSPEAYLLRSAGNKRAMALAQGTGVILMDEPTTFLDIRNQLEMLDFIRELSGEGKTVVMILHDFDLTLRYADWCLLMGGGRALRAGPPRDVLASEELRSVFRVEPRFCETEDGLHCFVKA